MENFGNTCYCNSILQCLYFSKPFRECVVNYPHRVMTSPKDISVVSSTFILPPTANGNALPTDGLGGYKSGLTRINTEPPSVSGGMNSTSPNSTVRSGRSPLSPGPKEDKRKGIPMVASIQSGIPGRAEDPTTPEYKKKAALALGPVLKLDSGNPVTYGMPESLFSALKDIFETIIAHTSRTGVVSPQKFVEILKRDNEMFRSSLHQDAHEFLNYVLNQVIENVEQYQRKIAANARANGHAIPPRITESLVPGTGSSAASTASELTSSTGNLSTGWIHDLFEGLLTSETKCLTCETISRRDEVFLDLSIDLDKHASVTSCLRNFSASEMLCERNKFHCDCCGGLQEAEKRMKIKRLPRILALHLKRFKYSEEIGRHQKLFHRVVYPYYLRLFNTTDDADDQDRLYELYAVVVHIGGGPYHGHYVSIVKTEDKGWLLFDDELVEPVDKSYIRNFFGDEKKLACAYVLFYQETTFAKMQKEMQDEGEDVPETEDSIPATVVEEVDGEKLNGFTLNGHDLDTEKATAALAHALTMAPPAEPHKTPAAIAAEHNHIPVVKSKKEKERERKEEKAAAKAAAKIAASVVASTTGSLEDESNEQTPAKENGKGFNRFRTTSKSISIGHSWFGSSASNGKDKKDKDKDGRKSYENGSAEKNGGLSTPTVATFNLPDPIPPTTTNTAPTTNGFSAAEILNKDKQLQQDSLDAEYEPPRNSERRKTRDSSIFASSPPTQLPLPPLPPLPTILSQTPLQTPLQTPPGTAMPSSTKEDGRKEVKTKEKKKSFFGGLKRKTSIMMDAGS
ncbi:putative ubiquitin carboxyl-terminal hydrolase creB [Peziza echinospora]|nr:putative ubiquitin carboxyl-terminal hydrolase creB [Peziza echinospora]